MTRTLPVRPSRLVSLYFIGLTSIYAPACDEAGDSLRPTDEPEAAVADTPSQLDAGSDAQAVAQEVYASLGHGYVVVFGPGDEVVSYAVADKRCWAQPVPADVWLASKRDGQTLWFDYFGQKQPPMTFVRRLSLDAVCPHGQLPTALEEDFIFDPEQELHLFWSSFEEHYAFFELRDVDWQAQRETALRSLPTAEGVEDYFKLLSAMVAPLKDGHVTVVAGDGLVFTVNERLNLDAMLAAEYAALREEETAGDAGARDMEAAFTDQGALNEGLQNAVASYIERERHTLREIVLSFSEDDELHTGTSGALSWARLRGGHGYLAVTRFSGFLQGPGSELAHADEHLAALSDELDQALKALEGMSGLVVDVRDNDGGWDVAGRSVASRFAKEPVIVYEKRTRFEDGWTESVALQVNPTERVPVTVPVVVLTGPGAVSAAETFVLAMREMPGVVTVGEATGGILSDALPKFLPSGIYFSLSNEEYQSAEGKVFERVGIPPDEVVEVFSQADRMHGRDGALERALQLLDEL